MQGHKDAYANKSYTPAPAPTKAAADGINQHHNGRPRQTASLTFADSLSATGNSLHLRPLDIHFDHCHRASRRYSINRRHRHGFLLRADKR